MLVIGLSLPRLLLVLMPAAHAGPPAPSQAPLLAVPMQAVAAAPAGVVAVGADGTVYVLDATARRLRTLAPASSSGGAGFHQRSRRTAISESWSALDVPADGGWVRAYDREEVDDADDPRWADDGDLSEGEEVPAGGQRPGGPLLRSGGPAGTREARDRTANTSVVAAGGTSAWIARGDELWQVDFGTGAATRRAAAAAGEVWAVAASADGATIAFIKGNLIYRSADRGATFQSAGGAEAPAVGHLMAASGGGLSLVDRTAGSWRVWAPQGTEWERLPQDGVQEATACGKNIRALADGVVHTVGWSPPARGDRVWATAPPGGAHIACGSGEALWIAGGRDLYETHDGGKRWTAVAPPPGIISGIAGGDGGVWVASSTGLWWRSAPATAGASAAAQGEAVTLPPAALPEGRARLGVFTAPSRLADPSERWWGALLPRVDLLFAVARNANRRELRGLVVLTFRAGGARTNGVRGRGAVLSDARWRSRENIAASDEIVAPAVEDPLAAAERSALNRTLQETSP